jgi:hypothetical protein
MVRLPQTTLRVTYAIGADVPVDLMVGKPPPNVPPEQVEQMLKQLTGWFEGSLLANWQELFERVVAATFPLRNRLRAVRIEEAKQPEDRIIILDGSDLVYRMNGSSQAGYFSDDEVAAIVPGVLAGLPTRIDSTVEGRRLLPLDGEFPTSDFYRERWVPRWMRRIRSLLDRPVRLQINWHRAAAANQVGAQLPRWGLNRVYGALALTCLNEARKQELNRELEAIEIAVGVGVDKRFARYDAGKLSVGLCCYGGDTPGCYEHEIAAALAGQPLEA